MDINLLQQAGTYLQIGIAAIATAIIVEGIKLVIVKVKGEDWQYQDVVTILSAYIIAVIVLFAARRANLVIVSEAVWWLILLQAVFVGAFASGGYEWVSKISGFTIGAVKAFRGGDTVGGDKVEVDHIEAESVAVGRESESSKGQK